MKQDTIVVFVEVMDVPAVDVQWWFSAHPPIHGWNLRPVDHGVLVVFFTFGACSLLPCGHLLQAVKYIVNQSVFSLHHVRSIMEEHVSNVTCVNKN